MLQFFFLLKLVLCWRGCKNFITFVFLVKVSWVCTRSSTLDLVLINKPLQQIRWGSYWLNALLKSLILEQLVIHSVHPAWIFELATYSAILPQAITTTLQLISLIQWLNVFTYLNFDFEMTCTVLNTDFYLSRIKFSHNHMKVSPWLPLISCRIISWATTLTCCCPLFGSAKPAP